MYEYQVIDKFLKSVFDDIDSTMRSGLLVANRAAKIYLNCFITLLLYSSFLTYVH